MTNEATMSGTIRGLLFSVVLMLPTQAVAEPSGEALAFTCAGCHGTDGTSMGPSSPSIAGMDPQVFIDAMIDYKASLRNSTIMNRIAKGYSDKQIVAMAAFFARQKLRTSAQQTDAALAAAGKELHDKYCEKCHEHGGKAGDAGTLAGQWKPYLEYSLQDFLGRDRRWPWRMRMPVEDAIKEKGDKAVEALLHYYASQHQD